MKTNQDIINAFVAGESAYNTNMHTDGNRLFSYSTCIAQKLANGKIVVNSTKYSTSTSRVQTYTRSTVKNYIEVFNVPINTYNLSRYVK